MKPHGRWLVVAAASGLVQSVAWFVFSLLAVLVYNCVIDLPQKPDPAAIFGTQLAQYYIADQLCPASKYFNLSVEVSQYVSLTSPDSVFVISCVIIVYSCLWFISSVLLMWEALRSVQQTRRYIFWCWTAVTGFVCLCDMGIFINFTVDYANTVSRLRSNPSYQLPNPMEILTYAGFMMSVSARGYTLWLLNVAATFFVGFWALGRGRGADDQEEKTSLRHHFLTSLYNERQEKLDGVTAPWAVQSPVVGTAPRPPPWDGGTPIEIPRPFRLGPPPPGRRRSAPIPEPDYDRNSLRRTAAAPPPPPPASPPHAKDALRRQPPPLDEMPRRSALKKAPAPRYSGKTVF